VLLLQVPTIGPCELFVQLEAEVVGDLLEPLIVPIESSAYGTISVFQSLT
jgi:hypothetical protein